MQLAARPYLAAGVALVGASAIAISPLAPPAPNIQVPAIHASSAAVALSAQANPLELWAEVIGTAFGNVGGLGEQLMADPAPILTQIIANQLHTFNALSAAAQTTADGLKAALAPDGWASFPASIQGALDLIAAGDLENGLASAVSSFILLALPLQIGVGMAWPALAQPFVNLGQLALHVNDMVPAILVSGLLSPLTATAAATGHVLDSLVSAASTGDLAEFATALANAPATVTGALLNGYDVFGTPTAGLLNPPDQWGIGGGISTVLTAIAGIANSIATPGADRGDLLGNLPGLGGTALQKADTTTVTLDVAPQAKIAAGPAASPAVTPSETEAEAEAEAADTLATDAKLADADSAPKADRVRVSLKAEPGKTTMGTTKSDRVTPVKSLRDGVAGAVKNVTDGLQKAVSGKKATTKSGASSTGSAGTGSSGSSDSGSGSDSSGAAD